MWSPTHVQVTVGRARNLKVKGKNGTNDAYVVIKFGKEKFQTSVRERTKEPDWWEQCDFPLSEHRPVAKLKIFHRNLVGRDDFLGQIELDVDQFKVHERAKAKWYPLMNKPGSKSTEQYRGEIEVVVSFNVKSLSSSQLTLSNKAFKSQSVTGASTAAAAAGSGGGGSLKALSAVRGIGDKMVNKVHLGGRSFRSESKQDITSDSPTRTRTSVILPMSYNKSQPSNDVTDGALYGREVNTSEAEDENDSNSENEDSKKAIAKVLPTTVKVKNRQLSHSGRFLSQSTVDISSFSSSRSLFGDNERRVTQHISNIEPVSEELDSSVTDNVEDMYIGAGPIEITVSPGATATIEPASLPSDHTFPKESRCEDADPKTNVMERTGNDCYFAVASRGQEAPISSFSDDNSLDSLHGDGRVRQRLEKLTEEDEIFCESKVDECLLEDNEQSAMNTNSDAATGIQQQASMNGRSAVSLTALDTIVDATQESNVEQVVRDARLDDERVAAPVRVEAAVDTPSAASERIATNNNGERDKSELTATSEIAAKYWEQCVDAVPDSTDVLSRLHNSHAESIPERQTLDSDVTKLHANIPNGDLTEKTVKNTISNGASRVAQTLELAVPPAPSESMKTSSTCVVNPINAQLSANIAREYSSYSREELIQLVVRQRIQLREREAQVADLEQYIDKLLAKVLEQQPLLLCAPCDTGTPTMRSTLSTAASGLTSSSPGLAAAIRSNAAARGTSGSTPTRQMSPFLRQVPPQSSPNPTSSTFSSSFGRQKLLPSNPFLSIQKMLK